MTSFYQKSRHKQWREKVLKRAKYLCEECAKYGRVDADGLPIRATIAHHVKHADMFPELRYDVRNGQALCAACHNKLHPEKAAKRSPPGSSSLIGDPRDRRRGTPSLPGRISGRGV